MNQKNKISIAFIVIIFAFVLTFLKNAFLKGVVKGIVIYFLWCWLREKNFIKKIRTKRNEKLYFSIVTLLLAFSFLPFLYAIYIQGNFKLLVGLGCLAVVTVIAWELELKIMYFNAFSFKEKSLSPWIFNPFATDKEMKSDRRMMAQILSIFIIILFIKVVSLLPEMMASGFREVIR